MAFLQEANVVLTPDKAHVGCGVHEGFRRLQVAAANLVSPELACYLELLGNADGTLGFHAAIRQLRGVVQFGKTGVARARVVPAIGALQSHAVKALEDFHLPVGLQLLQISGQRGAHCACAHHHHVHRLLVLCLGN